MKHKNEKILTKEETLSKKLIEKIEKNISLISSIFTVLLGVSIPLIVEYFDDIPLISEHIDSISFLIILLLATAVLFNILISYVKKNINNAHEKSYDNVRENLEKEIIEIQNKLSNSEEQWKTSYHLILSSQAKSIGDNDKAIRNLHFLKNFGLTEQDFIVDKKLIFYLTSFSEKHESTYKICKEVCEEMSLNLLRGDEIKVTGDIFSQIVKYIVKASLIIVNIDGKNPNVFYELGIAHALGKNIMFISNRNKEIPFDVRQYRTIFYNKNEDLKHTLPVSIKKYIEYSYKNDNYTMNINQLYKSIDVYLKVLEMEPQNKEALLSLGRIYMEMGHFEQAEQYFYKVLELDENNINPLMELANLYETKEDYKRAYELYSYIVKKDSNNTQALLKLANLLSKN